METRASYIAVGAFFLLLLLGGIVFALWASKYSSSTVMVNHYLRVDGSVAGLNTGSQVLFGGIPIGKVTKIVIDPVDPTLTRIDMTVRADAPIKTDSVGVLASKSLIGGAIIEISRGGNEHVRGCARTRSSPASPPGRGSITGAPKLVEKAASLQEQLDRFLTPQNTVAMVRILANADRLSTEFTQLSSQFDGFYDRTNASSAEVKKAWADISQALTDIGKNGNRLMEDANKAIADVTRTGNRLGQSRDKLDQLLNENTRRLQGFREQRLSPASRLDGRSQEGRPELHPPLGRDPRRPRPLLPRRPQPGLSALRGSGPFRSARAVFPSSRHPGESRDPGGACKEAPKRVAPVGVDGPHTAAVLLCPDQVMEGSEPREPSMEKVIRIGSGFIPESFTAAWPEFDGQVVLFFFFYRR